MFALFNKFKKRIYLDYASVTPIDERVIREVSKNCKDFPANPSSLYKEGVGARKKLEDARSGVAKCLEVHADEIFFTSGGTESNNLAIQGVLMAAKKMLGLKMSHVPHVVSSKIEHPSIRELLEKFQKNGWCTVSYIPVGENGIVDTKEIKKALRPETVLVSVMYANNEIGTVQPIHEIAKVIRDFKKNRKDEASGEVFRDADFPYFHTDACQAAAYESLRQPYLGADLITLDGSKIYGPRGMGVLYVKRGVKVEPLMHGGSQEKRSQTIGGRSSGFRPGTENVADAAGFALALEICQEEKEQECTRLSAMRDELLFRIKKAVPNVLINGDSEKRLPNNINICLPGIDAEFAVLKLDARGVCVSSVTSCRTQNEDASSYVIEALRDKNSGGSHEEDIKSSFNSVPADSCSRSSLRVTLGRFTSKKDIKQAAKYIIEVLTSML